jgi:hypothetical protein
VTKKPSSSLLRNKRSARNLRKSKEEREGRERDDTTRDAAAASIAAASLSANTGSSSADISADAPDSSDADEMDHGPYVVEPAHMVAFPHMDIHHHQQQPGAVPAMRPFYQPVEPEYPYPRVTPRTGRLSRAKKGLPVHYCEPCNKVCFG